MSKETSTNTPFPHFSESDELPFTLEQIEQEYQLEAMAFYYNTAQNEID